MKFKMQNKQNQLIERISVNHLVVGVHIAQQFHVARAVNFRGIVVGDPLTFKNNDEGFSILLGGPSGKYGFTTLSLFSRRIPPF
ncbi:hypothetical protein BIV60_14155 [Bacillus sp. MUM 116]|nr:hypothetical protein BIV60_14155 [Bacillus sp. MUM 116]